MSRHPLAWARLNGRPLLGVGAAAAWAGSSAACSNEPATLIDPDDLAAADSDPRDAEGGILGMPPCRALRSLNQDLNLQAAGKHAGTQVSTGGGGYVFAVIFAPSATPSSAAEVVAEVPAGVKDGAKELDGDSTRKVDGLSGLPRGVVGYRGEENTLLTEYAYATTTTADRLLVVGAEHPTSGSSSVSIADLLDAALKNAPDVATD